MFRGGVGNYTSKIALFLKPQKRLRQKERTKVAKK